MPGILDFMHALYFLILLLYIYIYISPVAIWGVKCQGFRAHQSFLIPAIPMMKLLLLIWSFISVDGTLAPGDCAFVGIYGNEDDFALVLLEDAAGENIYVTEGSPDSDFTVEHWAAAKAHVSDAKRGSILKKADFQTGTTSFLAPVALSAFKGNPQSPTVLCSINLEASKMSRKLQDVSMVLLNSMETAEYAGPTHGSKEALQEEIAQPSNWLHAHRQLADFSIASGNATVTSTMTATMTTTMTTTMTVGDDLPMTDAAAACSIFGAAVVAMAQLAA